MAGCEFDIRTSITVVQHEFNHSWSRGIRAIGEELANSFSRVREIQAPTGANFGLTYEINNGRLYWPGDRLSVEAHMRRNIVWLKANSGTEAQIKQARLDLLVFREIQHRALSLDDGQSVMWLAQKTTEPTDGVALQQIKKQGDKLMQSSQLLPFDQQSEIDNFMNSVNENREEVSVENGVGGWIVQGEGINFEQDLPAMIDQAMLSSVALEYIPETMPLIYPAVMRTFETVAVPLPAAIVAETVIPVSEANGFWFEVMAAAATPVMAENSTSITSRPGPEVFTITETQAPEYVDKETSSSELEVVDIQKIDEIVPTRTDPVVVVREKPARITPKVIEKAQPVSKVFESKKEAKRSVPNIVREYTTSKTVFEVKPKEPAKKKTTITSGRVLKVKQKRPTRLNFVGKKTADVSSASEHPVFNTDEILVWQPKIVAKWQDYTIYILAFFYALLSTKPIRLTINRGSGHSRQQQIIFTP